MKTVHLGGKKAAGRVALVDDEDYDLVLPYNWYCVEVTTPGKRSGPYARTTVFSDTGKSGALFMHNLIVDYPKPDHIDGDGLNNQRSNLRRVSASQSAINRRTWGRSAYRGVCWYRRYSKWNATITYRRKSRNLGYFASEEDAALAYDAAARELHGAFARLNFPDAA